MINLVQNFLLILSLMLIVFNKMMKINAYMIKLFVQLSIELSSGLQK